MGGLMDGLMGGLMGGLMDGLMGGLWAKCLLRSQHPWSSPLLSSGCVNEFDVGHSPCREGI